MGKYVVQFRKFILLYESKFSQTRDKNKKDKTVKYIMLLIKYIYINIMSHLTVTD